VTPAIGYTEMKDSGIKWMGEIPKHWGLVRAKFYFKQTNNRGNDSPILLAASQKYGVCPQSWLDGVVQVAEGTDLQQFKTVHKDDFIISLRSFQGGFERSGFEGVCSPAYQVFHANGDYNNDYLRYLFKNEMFIDEMNSLTVGIREGRNIKYEDFANSLLFLPPLDEQKAIASYLDVECAKIDEIIAEAKASIEDYKQWKASVIYEAVTKGLDPDVEMKDSGVEFIGFIPAHWRITSLKRLCQRISDGSHFSPETTVDGFPYVTAGDVHGKGIDYSKCRTISEEDFQNLVKTGCQPQLGDVLLVKDGATTGRVGMMTDDMPCVLLSSVAMLTPKDNVLSEYLMRLIESEVLQFQIRKSMAGSAMPRTTLTKLMAYSAIDCPYQEQRMIAEYLDKKCLHIDELISEKESLISDLETYKKALIYEVVTGKRRIPALNETTVVAIHPSVLAYQKALLMCRVLDLLGNNARGRIHVQKCLFAVECLLKMPFQTQYTRYQHGPYDTRITDYEALINGNNWFTVQNGSPVTYRKGTHFDAYLAEYMKVFAKMDSKIREIVEFLKPMKTSQAERVATLLAAWNDFILDGTTEPTDQQIVDEVMTNWTPNKANIQVSTWQDTLNKLKQSGFVPNGFGVHTITKEAQEV